MKHCCVLGAAGGVGLTAIEIGKALGARVLAGASTPEKLELAKRHGADAVFNYTQDTIKAKVMEFTGDRGIDVAYDPVGADFAEQVVRLDGLERPLLGHWLRRREDSRDPVESGVAQGLLSVGEVRLLGALHAAKEPGTLMLPI